MHLFDLDTAVLSSMPNLHTIKLLPPQREHINTSTSISYEDSFAATLYGLPFLAKSLTSPEPTASPYSGRLLRPFIWRDYVSQPPGMMLLEEIRNLYRCVIVWWTEGLCCYLLICTVFRAETEDSMDSIDYCHFQFWHLDQVNDLLWRIFWPGIDGQ